VTSEDESGEFTSSVRGALGGKLVGTDELRAATRREEAAALRRRMAAMTPRSALSEPEREAVLSGLRAAKERMDEAQERYDEAIGAYEREILELIDRGLAVGVGVTSLSKALGVSRGRLNRIIGKGRPK